MKKLLRSFLSGAGSILSIYPQRPAPAGDVIEAIGGDFSRIGEDLSRALQTKAGSITSQRSTQVNGEEKAEQLYFIPG